MTVHNHFSTPYKNFRQKFYWSLLAGFCTNTVIAEPINKPVDIGSNTTIEEVIVTASKRQLTPHDFSGSVSVTSLQGTAPPAGIEDIARETPGFSVLDAGPRNPASLIIRGLRTDPTGSNDFGGDGGTVASYVDNIPLQGYFVPPAFSLKDLQQVEILRGPQGTLYGNSSIGGLVRYVTAKPDLARTTVSVTTSLSQTADSDGINYDTDLVVNLPLAVDTLGVRLLLGKTHNEGFIDAPYLISGPAKDVNDDTTRQARLTALWQPTAEFSLAGSYHYQKNNSGDRQASNQAFTGDEYTASNKYKQPAQGELRLSSLDLGYQFDWAKLTTSVNRYDYKNHQQADQTDYLLRLDQLYEWGYYSSYDKFSAYTTGAIDVQKDSAEFRLVSPDDQPLRWLIGAFYSTDDLAVTLADTVPGFGNFAGEDRPHDLDYYATQAEALRETSLYSEVAYDVKPQWEILLGARHFQYNDETETCSLLFPTATEFTGDNYPVNCLQGNDKQNGNLGKFSTKYTINPQQNIYFTVTEGFRRGGANALPVEILHNRRYKADTAVNYEAGTHNNLLDQRVSLSAALFYIDWSDIQVTSIIDGRYNGYVNAKSAKSQGVELEANVKISNTWKLKAGFSFTDAKLTEDVANINGSGENAYSGNRLPGSPRYQWNLGIEYAQSINTATLETGFSLTRNSDIYTALNPEFTNYDVLSGYNIANAHADVSVRNWRAGIFVHNITNELGITGKRSADLFGEQGQFEYITRPRTIGLSLNYHY